MLHKQYVIVKTKEDVKNLFKYVEESTTIAIDTETDSLNPRTGNIVGWSVTSKIGTGYYLPTLIYEKESDKLKEYFIEKISGNSISKKILPYLKGKKIITHNGSFDCQFILNYYGINLIPYLWADTTLLVHTVQEEGAFGYGSPFALKSIAIMNQKKLGLNVEEEANAEQIALKESIKENGGSTAKSNFEIYKADLEILGTYGAADTDLTLRIYYLYLEILKEEKLESFFFEEEVMPIYREVTIPMEMRGVNLDLSLIQKVKKEIEEDLSSHKSKVLKSLLKRKETQEWIVESALKEFPPKAKGTWVQSLLEKHSIDLPKTKTGKYSLSKKNIDALPDSPIKNFLQTGDIDVLDLKEIIHISTSLWKEKNDGTFINIQSKKHLRELVFDHFGETANTQTKSGADAFDDNVIEELSKKYEWAEQLRIYNRLLKIKSTYIDRFLEGEENGKYYFYFKQHGTVSGRYGSDAQQLPKPKEEGEDHPTVIKYNNLVRAFLIASPGMKFIDDDYVSLEPRIFAALVQDEGLKDIYKNGWDFYSTVAIKTEKLDQQTDKYPNGVSPDTKASNYLKKIDPVKRDQAKPYSLGLAYGMSPYALAMTLNIPQKEAKELYEGYLNGFPKLREWINTSREFVKKNGYIKNKLGRIRHLFETKELYDRFGDRLLDWKFRKDLELSIGQEQVLSMYRTYRNQLNNCLNFQIQSMAASIVNRAALHINRKAKELGINALVVAQIHDQLVIEVEAEKAEEFAPIVQYIMENTTPLDDVELIAEPEIADNMYEGH